MMNFLNHLLDGTKYSMGKRAGMRRIKFLIECELNKDIEIKIIKNKRSKKNGN